MVWSGLIEPGDEFAGFLRCSFGAVESLALVTKGKANHLREAITSEGFQDEVTARFGDVEKVIRDSLERWGSRLEASCSLSQHNGNFQVITPRDSFWPAQLEDLGWAAPALLWVNGDPERVSNLEKSVAFVGSRSNSNYGEWVTAELVSKVGQRGYSIVSGGAYGIDGIAHRTALALDIPTAAVLAGGVDRLYPSGHIDLLNEIARNGVLLSELPPGSSPTKWRFLQRNRLIAALTKVTVVVEAGWRSGSINTANHAFNLSRPVAAVPGSVTSANSAGCHRLIREQVAQLVTTGDDILELLGFSNQLFPSDQDGIGALETRALDALARTAQTVEQVAAKAGLTHSEANLALTSLEVSGLASGAYGKWRKTGHNL